MPSGIVAHSRENLGKPSRLVPRIAKEVLMPIVLQIQALLLNNQ